MKKVLFVSTVVRLHMNMFHQPFIKWFHDQGWQVDVAANNDYDNPEDCIIPYCDHFYCLPFERSPLRKENINVYKQLKEIIDREQYDVIHCHTPVGGVLTRLAASDARKKGTKVLYTAHGFHFFKGSPLKNWLLFYPVEKAMARKTDLLITMNEEDYRVASKFKAKRSVMVNGVGIDLTKFKSISNSDKNEIRKELGLLPDDIFAISVGELSVRKNQIVLIQAVAKLNNSKFHLFLCGDGNQEKLLKSEIEKLGLQKQVHLLGFRRDVYKLCSGADLFLFASTQEGLPVAVMEAMACGLPVIASKVRGNADLIDQGKGGYLVDPINAEGFAQAIDKILLDNQSIERMKQYNLQRIQPYSKDYVMKQMSELYRSVM